MDRSSGTLALPSRAPAARYAGAMHRHGTTPRRARRLLIPVAALAAFAAGVMIEPDTTRWSAEMGPVSTADARVGRPLTPLSYAGVARRTTRRVVRRTTIYVATLPRGCATVTIDGASFYQCGTTYYQAAGGQYVVVHIE